MVGGGQVDPWYVFAAWGAIGGGIIDGFEFWAIVRQKKGKIPAYFKTPGYWIGEVLRLAGGAAMAVAFGDSGQVTGALGALTVGVSAPLLVKRLSQEVPEIPE